MEIKGTLSRLNQKAAKDVQDGDEDTIDLTVTFVAQVSSQVVEHYASLLDKTVVVAIKSAKE